MAITNAIVIEQDELFDIMHRNHNKLVYTSPVFAYVLRNIHSSHQPKLRISIWKFRTIGCQVFVFHQTQIQLHYNSRTRPPARSHTHICTTRSVVCIRRARCDEIFVKWNCESSTLIKWSGASWITTTDRRKTRENRNFSLFHFVIQPFCMRKKMVLDWIATLIHCWGCCWCCCFWYILCHTAFTEK